MIVAVINAPAPAEPARTRLRPLTRLDPELTEDLVKWAAIGRRAGSWEPRRKGPWAPRKPRRGRPSKLNPEVLSKFYTAIRAGESREGAARYAGIAPATLYRWLRDRRRRFIHFRRLLVQAEGAVAVMVSANLLGLSETSTAAAVACLRARRPEEWPTPRRGRR